MKNIYGIQMIGTQRSGSNLLRVMLEQSADVVSPHPAHVLVTFIPLLKFYGNLDITENYRRLVNDVVDYIDVNPVPWNGVILDKEDIFNSSQVYNLIELNRIIYERIAAVAGARYWCCKSMANVHFADELEAGNEDLKYIYLYRDGRDVAASFKKAIVGEKHIYPIAKQWTADQEACLRLSQKIPAKRLYSLSYERLIKHPEETIKQLCIFLDIPYLPAMLEYHSSKEAVTTASAGAMWINLQKPVMADNTGKFRKVFTDTDLEIFELVAGDVMQELGYPLFTNRQNVALISSDAIEKYQLENEQLKKEFIKQADNHDIEKRQPQLAIVNRIKHQ